VRTTSRPRLALPIAALVAVASVLVSACSTFAGPAWQVGDTSVSVEQFYTAFEESQGSPTASTSTSTERISTTALAGFMTEQIQDELIEQMLENLDLEVTQEDLDNAQLALQQQGATAQPSERDLELQATSVVLGTQLLKAALDEGRYDLEQLVREAFEADKESYETPPQTCAHVILVRAGSATSTAEPTDEQLATALTEAEATATRLATEDFEAVANDVMDPGDLEQQPGGDVGCLPTEQVNPELGTLLESLDVDEISVPTRFDPFGYIIVRVDSRTTEATPAVLEDVQDQVTQQVVQELTSQLVGEYVQEQVRNAFVVVDPRFGTWSPDEFAVLPPAGPATPTVPTTANPLLPTELGGLGAESPPVEQTGP
jgi:parvulin-like peptidyl-prolyl isomerase